MAVRYKWTVYFSGNRHVAHRKMKCIGFIFLPAYLAAWLLFGMLFSLAIVHFMAISWPRFATVVVYVMALVWVSGLALQKWRHVWPVTALDVLFVGFVLLVSALLTFQGNALGAAGKFAYYLPFMVVTPYLCGRMMRAPDIDLLLRILLIAGVAILPLLLLDRFTSLGREGGRWPFFGLDHGALLVGCLLATALLALCVRVLGCRSPIARNDRAEMLVSLGLIGVVTVFLVWVMARGWLLAGLVAVAVTCLSARHRLLTTRLGLLVAVLTIAGVTVASLPRLAPVSGGFYAMLLTPPAPLGMNPPRIPFGANPSHVPFGANPSKAEPILGEASCQPFKEGINSVAMRWVLYREAMAMFKEHPYIGVGASRFGEYSCTGYGGFPHSTVLQGFAELGLIGGALLAGLLALAAITLARPLLSIRQCSDWSADAFALALFVTFAVADQIYGNYFMSVGTWLMLGIAASMRANIKREMLMQ